MFRVDVFVSDAKNAVQVHSNSTSHAIAFERVEVRMILNKSQSSSNELYVVAIPKAVTLDVIVALLRPTRVTVLEDSKLDSHGFYSLIIGQESAEQCAKTLKTRHGSQITANAVFYLLPLAAIEFHASNDQTEIDGETLPPCPACLERIDFTDALHNPCFKQDGWASSMPLSNCPVCICLQQSIDDGRARLCCPECGELSELQVCMICGLKGCGRYRAGHAKEHSKATGHTLCIDIDSGRIWDYLNDRYRHRRLKTGEIQLDWKALNDIESNTDCGKEVLEREEGRIELLNAEVPEEYSVLKALRCAWKHSLDTGERKEAEQLECFIHKWTEWSDQFVVELLKRRTNFEFALEDLERRTSREEVAMAEETKALQIKKAALEKEHKQNKVKLKRKRRKLKRLQRRIEALKEERDLLTLSTQDKENPIPLVSSRARGLQEKIAATQADNDNLTRQIAEAYARL